MKNRNSRMREIAFHTLFCMVSMVSILLTMQKKYTSENDPLQAQITMREFQFFESIIEKSILCSGLPQVGTCSKRAVHAGGISKGRQMASWRRCRCFTF
jgi:hypothetical protein